MVRVTAVIASHNGATYLPDTLAALRGQSRVPDQFIAVNAASTDETAEIFREQLPDSAVFLDAPEGGFGAALAVADDFLPAPVADIQDWLWIHHDDAAPDPQALAVLLEAAERSPSVVIAGCKQVEAGRERALVDVGLSVTRRAERLTMLELDEQDQGQHDGASDVFAVNSAGLLVRLDVWRELRGFDPSLPFVGDDVDLAWRARAAGYRVIVVPAARMIHEPLGVKARVDRTAQRRASSYLRLKHATSWAVPLVAISLILGGIGRFFSGVFAKDLPYGAGQLGASIAPLWHPIKLLKARRLAAKTRKVPRSVDKRAFASPADVAHIRRRNRDLHATQVAATAAPVASQIVTEAGTEDPAHATGGHDDFDALETAVKPSIVPALSVLTLLTLVMSFIGFRHLFGAPALVGGSLLPLSTSLNEAWHNVIDWWQNTGMGVASASDPFDALILAASAVTGGQPNFLGICIYFASMTLAGWSALWFLRTVTTGNWLRFLGAFIWAVHPTLITALASGRPGAVLAHMVLPVASGALFTALGVRDGKRLDTQSGTRVANRAVFALATAIISMGSPITGAFMVIMVLVAAILSAAALFFMESARPVSAVLRRVRSLWWTPLPMLVLLAPNIAEWFTQRHPSGDLDVTQALREFLLEPGVPQAYSPAPLWQQLLGFPVAFPHDASAFGLPVLVAACLVGVPLLLVAAVAVFVPKLSGKIARYSLLVGLLALSLSGVGTLATISLDRGSVVVPFIGPLVSVFTLALIIAGIAVTHAGFRRAAKRVSASVLVVGLLASSALFMVPRAADSGDAAAVGAGQAVVAGRDMLLPATAADRGRGEFEEKTLVIETGSADPESQAAPAVRAKIMNRAGETLDSMSAAYSTDELRGPLLTPERADATAADTQIRNVVGSIVTGNAADVRASLASLGVSFVVIDGIVDATDPLLSRVRSVPGLAEVGVTSAGWLWRVNPLDGVAEATGQPAASTANVRVLKANGDVEQFVPSHFSNVKNTNIPAGQNGRVVVLAQQRDSGWTASVNGHKLEAAVNVPGIPEWAQAFQLPAEGGTLEVHYESPWRIPVFIGGALILLVVLLLAIPLPKRQLARLSEAQRYRPELKAQPLQQPAEHTEEVPHDA